MESQLFKSIKLNKKPSLKAQLKKNKKNFGRNNEGKITVRHKGGGQKRRYRKIIFEKKTFVGIVFSIEYDPNRNSDIASIFCYQQNKFFYVIAPKDLSVGNIIKSGSEAERKTGHSMQLGNIPVGCCIHNISFKKSIVAKISRSAGTYSVIIEKTKNHVEVLLSSGKKKHLPLESIGTIGIVSNELTFLTQLGKAGRSRWLGKRPTVRGVAMNPVDHPHGGGENKKSGKRKTPWGKSMNSRKNGF